MTDARSRRASLQARAISCSTAASAFGEGVVSGVVIFLRHVACSVAKFYGISSNFTQFEKGFLNPSPYLARAGGHRMSGVSFNRKRVKLKKLLGIRARLALLAVILVAPLMLERVRSLEDTRGKQIAQAADEFANITQHSAETQREVISSVETMLKSAAYIRASSGIGSSCDILRASLPANLPWIRSIMIVGKDGTVQCST